MSRRHFLTFVHLSPYATWNSLQAWVRRERSAPHEVTILHLDHPRVRRHAALVARGVETILAHYGAAPTVRIVPVPRNTLPAWRDAIRAELGQGDGPTAHVIDVTPARTIPKLAVTAAVVPGQGTAELFYLDVEGYRYESKPFPCVPYNVQTIRSLTDEGHDVRYARVQYLGPPPNATPLARISGQRRVGPGGHRETSMHWEDLIVLLNEACASTQRKGAHGVEQFQVKLPAIGVPVATYNLETLRFRLEPFARIRDGIQRAIRDLDGIWQRELPQENHLIESLAAARLLPYRDQAALERELHTMAAATRSRNPGVPAQALAIDTNLFYFDFVTTLARAAGLPTLRVPVVASGISRAEIQNRMDTRFPATATPRMLKDAEVERPLMARLAHAAHEEFEGLRTRCRMDVVHGESATNDGGENDARIVRDLARHAKDETQRLLVVSNDRGFVQRAHEIAPTLDTRHIAFGDPDESLAATADVDQVAYLIHRLAIGYGKVSLKGLGVEVLGDHPDAKKYRYAHEEVRVRVPETEWAAGFLHERALRPQLDRIVQDGGLWLL